MRQLLIQSYGAYNRYIEREREAFMKQMLWHWFFISRCEISVDPFMNAKHNENRIHAILLE